MKKALLFFIFLFSLFSATGQTTETFENIPTDAQTFTTGGVTFNLSSPYNFVVYGNRPDLGYNSSDKFIHVLDPLPLGSVNPYGQTGKLKIASGSFKLNSFWLYLSGDAMQNPNATRDGQPGNATIKGKLAGNTQFTIVKPVTGTSIGNALPGNGFELIDLATAGGANNTNVSIDELEITLSNHLDYFAIDDFRITTGAAVVDVTPPTVTSMDREHPSPTNLNDVVFSISFSEEVTGLDINDFTVVGLPATVSGLTLLPDNRYNISVGNISGSGTLGLNLKASGTGITDLAGNPINGGFTGPVYTIDQTAPAAPVVVTPANGSTVNSQLPLVSGIAEVDSRISVTIDGNTINNVATANASGYWSYTPPANLPQGAHTVSARASDQAGNIGNQSNTNTFTVVLAPTIIVNPTTISDAKVGLAYSQTFSASGSTGSYSFSLSSGTLPPGLSLNPTTGALTGIPTAAGAFIFTIKATDASAAPGPYSGTRAYTLDVDPPTISLAPGIVTGATVATNYNQSITATGGIAPYTYTVTAGALPAGLSLSSSGTISGTPTAGGTFIFTVTAKGSSIGTGAPHTGSRAYSLTVAAPTLTLNPTSLSAATAYSTYSQTLTASGGTASYTYSITSGTLPNGISLSSGGVLSGTPIAEGTFNFTVTAKDASTGTGPYLIARAYTLNVAVSIVIAPATLASMTYGAVYNQTLSSSGGVAPYSYSLASGSLPIGVSMSSAGVISGTPRSFGFSPIIVRSTDLNNLSITKTYNLAVPDPVLFIIPAILPTPVLGVMYDRPLTSSGGIAPYTYSLASGTMPPGLSISSTGFLSGTPTSAGTYNFAIKSADDGSASTITSYTLTIARPTLVITPATLPAVTVGTAYSETLSTSAGYGNYSYSIVSGSLPTGVTLSPAGILSGTPTTKGTYAFTVRSTDSSTDDGPYSADKNYSIVVQGKAQTITMASTATVNYGNADFSPGATTTSGLPITYTTSNSAIATIVAGKVHIVKAGQVTIYANQAGNTAFAAASQKQQTLTINKAQLSYVANAATKIYGAVNPALSGTVTGFKYADNLAGSTTGTASFTTTATTTTGIGNYAINGSGLTAVNYTFVQAATNATRLSITRRELTITADNKEKFAGAVLPTFTASYSGFVNGETQTVVTTKPALSTTATADSPVGTYDINASGAVAANYSFKYVKGVLTIKPGAPTDISLAAVTLYENRPSGTNAGTLNSVSPDPSATFTYTLVPGAGDTDNSLFAISTNKLNTTASLNFEQKAVYSIRVRSTTQYALTFEKTLNVTIADVNEVPTLDAITNLPICYTTNLQTVALTGISAGPESGQTVLVSVTSDNDGLFESLEASNSGTTGSVNYRVKTGTVGTATVTVTVKDNGGTANGGVDAYSRTFMVTVNPLPVLAINSDKGNIVSKGEVVFLTATGASNYAWTGNNGIVNGANSAVLQIRPTVTTTYTLTGTNSSGCSETQTFTVTVLDDLAKIKATNILTPNNDGYNDKWVIDNIDVYPENDVKVFDKAGRIVYTKKGYDNSWDGQMNGTALNEGTYYYVIDFGQGKRKIRGYITVIRNN